MAGSAADTPTTPEFIRVSDTDRDRAVDELRKEFVDGRLSHDTFLLRMQAALDARNHGQLSGLFSDLPPRVSWVTRARQAVRQWGHDAREAVADNLPRRREDVYYHEEPPPRLPLPALPEPDRVPKPLLFPPGPDTSFTIGRDQRCDLYIADMTVSRLHARLSRGHEGWLLSDLGSSNGTRVNGWRLRAPVPVRPGDAITFGSAVFVLQHASPQHGIAQAGGQPDAPPGEGDPGHLEG